MTSANVTNTSRSPLGLPRGPIIDPGKTVRVNDWDKKESNIVVQAWLKAGALTVEAVEDDGLRQDGPTIQQFVESGYRAENYPPDGYASRSTDAEIAAAIKAQSERDNPPPASQAETPQTPAPAAASQPWAKPQGDANADDREKALREMTNAELKAHIEARGGKVEGSPVKDELVKLALGLPVDAPKE